MNATNDDEARKNDSFIIDMDPFMDETDAIQTRTSNGSKTMIYTLSKVVICALAIFIAFNVFYDINSNEQTRTLRMHQSQTIARLDNEIGKYLDEEIVNSEYDEINVQIQDSLTLDDRPAHGIYFKHDGEYQEVLIAKQEMELKTLENYLKNKGFREEYTPNYDDRLFIYRGGLKHTLPFERLDPHFDGADNVRIRSFHDDDRTFVIFFDYGLGNIRCEEFENNERNCESVVKYVQNNGFQMTSSDGYYNKFINDKYVIKLEGGASIRIEETDKIHIFEPRYGGKCIGNFCELEEYGSWMNLNEPSFDHIKKKLFAAGFIINKQDFTARGEDGVSGTKHTFVKEDGDDECDYVLYDYGDEEWQMQRMYITMCSHIQIFIPQSNYNADHNEEPNINKKDRMFSHWLHTGEYEAEDADDYDIDEEEPEYESDDEFDWNERDGDKSKPMLIKIAGKWHELLEKRESIFSKLRIAGFKSIRHQHEIKYEPGYLYTFTTDDAAEMDENESKADGD